MEIRKSREINVCVCTYCEMFSWSPLYVYTSHSRVTQQKIFPKMLETQIACHMNNFFYLKKSSSNHRTRSHNCFDCATHTSVLFTHIPTHTYTVTISISPAYCCFFTSLFLAFSEFFCVHSVFFSVVGLLGWCHIVNMYTCIQTQKNVSLALIVFFFFLLLLFRFLKAKKRQGTK